jgi:hypothetical protein
MSDVTPGGVTSRRHSSGRARSVPSVLRKGLVLTVAAVIAIIAAAAWVALDDRVSEVIPGQIVRSARLGPDELRQTIAEFDIRTVVSLAASGPEDDWVGSERRLCESMGVAHITLPFSAGEWPSRLQVERLVGLLDRAQRPLLLHCLRGIDRVGWASAVSLLLADVPLDRALREMSPRTGHVCDPRACPLHRFFEAYRRHLAEVGRSGSGSAFRAWVADSYCPEPYNAELVVLDELPERLAPRQQVRLAVRVTNRGADAWRMTDNRAAGVRLGARILGPFETPPDDPVSIFRTPGGPAVDIARSGIEPGVVAPGDRRDFELRFRAPGTPGRYVIQIDMVDELVHWFSDLGWPGIVRVVEVDGALNVER